MWRTNIGDRVLEGSERSFYIELMAYAIDRLEEYDNAGDLDFAPITGDRIFDSANFGQKILLLRDSLAALIDPSIPTPKHQNTNEAAAYYPFAVLRDEIELEIEIENSANPKEPWHYYWREFVWTVFEEYCRADWEEASKEDPDFIPLILDCRSTDLELFRSIIGDLERRIFWDMDWQLSYHDPQILDGMEPEIEKAMGYGDNYFTTRIPKVTKSELEAAIDYIKSANKN
jgi:hypothetical protein